MYDTIMQFPLFKGVTADQISDFLEKAELEFQNYTASEAIIRSGETVSRLGFVVSGEVKVINELSDGDIVVSQVLGKGFWLMADSLFGYTNSSSSLVESVRRSSVMWMRKDNFLDLIANNRLCMLNYLNFLCYKSQSRRDLIDSLQGGSLFERWLSSVLMCCTERRASSITISVSAEKLSSLLSLDAATLKEQMQKLSRQRKISFSDGLIKINHRREFL